MQTEANFPLNICMSGILFNGAAVLKAAAAMRYGSGRIIRFVLLIAAAKAVREQYLRLLLF